MRTRLVYGLFLLFACLHAKKNVSQFLFDHSALVTGDLDKRLRLTGIIKQPFLTAEHFDLVTGLLLDAQGRTIVVGYSGNALTRQWKIFLLRYSCDGFLDHSFGIGGVVLGQFSPFLYDQINAVAVQRDGSIVVAGETQTGMGTYNYFLARYTHVGQLDQSFGQNGVVIHPSLGSGCYDEVNALAVQPNGSIVAAGYSKDAGGQKISLVRYTSCGTVDTTFGNSGVLLQPFVGDQHCDTVAGVVVQSDGSVVVAGAASDGGIGRTKIVLIRYTASGQLDHSFGSGGLVVQPCVGSGAADQCKGVVLQPDARLLVFGSTSDQGGTKGLILRYQPNGSLDQSFGVEGAVKQPFLSVVPGEDCINALALQPSGTFVVAGKTGSDIDFKCFDAQYFPSGAVDTAFGCRGKSIYDFFGTDTGDEFLAVGLQSNGKIVLAGYAQDEDGSKVLVIRQKGTFNLASYKACHPCHGGFY